METIIKLRVTLMTDTAVVAAAPGIDVWIVNGAVNSVEAFDEGLGKFPAALALSTKTWGDSVCFGKG
jgi:hypothetical protein